MPYETKKERMTFSIFVLFFGFVVVFFLTGVINMGTGTRRTS